MIVDALDHLGKYFPGTISADIAEFLVSLNEQSGDGEYPLKGSDVFAKVMTYRTRSEDEAILESHRQYIDIQTVISGSEGIGWYPTTGLAVNNPYDQELDVAFHVPPGRPPARVDVTPGFFVALFPQDAHMPQLQVSGRTEMIKKVVVKVKVTLLNELIMLR